MAANFRTRPWLLVPARPASLAPFLVGAPRLLAPATGQTRNYAKRLDGQLRKHKMGLYKGSRTQPSTQALMQDMMSPKNSFNPAEMATLAPGTIVPIPLSKALPTFGFRPTILYYYWAVLKQRLIDRFQIFQMSIQARKAIFKFTPEYFKATRKGITEVASQLHATMSYCIAGGTPSDQAELARICVPKLQRSLFAVIEARPMGKSYKWERLEILKKPWVVDHKWAELPLGPHTMLNFRQAVVGIKSRQRLTERDAKGRAVGAPREVVLTEYLVLWRKVDMDTMTLGPWKLAGTLKETSFKELNDELQSIKTMADLSVRERLEKQKKQALEAGEAAAGSR